MMIEDKLPSVEAYFQSQRVKLFGDGVWRSAYCHFHYDKKLERMMRINMKKGQFFCFQCGVEGKDFIQYHEKRYGLSFVKAVKRLGAWKADK
ncbi:hypothetical protein A4F89_05530 [Polynucleobacter asymbioticus]|jgi:DNA primase|uniref:Zinc finger CHC2-type domain-containing protein n=2 Tax=Polynucleobacter asymbioticus TaxID=576611 RepID=A0AAC9IV34_9BURK|nr:CHC2 zinc finger domain-containing protein [Polynucleobacter asymbioticus]APB98825.1 hypothetical protein A4F89_05530 [Polynucleobacter asymbioticus]APC01128.1 hypothetical protein AOC25_05625 [Polynucleobacter asymbioticus]